MSKETRLGIIETVTCFVLIALMVIGFFAAIIGIELFLLFGGPYILYALSMGYITSHELLFYGWCIAMIPTMLIWLKGMLARQKEKRKEKWLM